MVETDYYVLFSIVLCTVAAEAVAGRAWDPQTHILFVALITFPILWTTARWWLAKYAVDGGIFAFYAAFQEEKMNKRKSSAHFMRDNNAHYTA